MTTQTIKKLHILCLIALFALMIPVNARAAYPLPHYSELPEGKTMPIDGVWLITSKNSRLRISKGRAYAIDHYAVGIFGAWKVEPENGVLNNIVYLGQGTFRGDELTYSGQFIAKVHPSGNLAFQIGWTAYDLSPIELDDPIEYIGMMTQAGLDEKNSPFLKNWVAAEKKKRALKQAIENAGSSETDSSSDSTQSADSTDGADSSAGGNEPVVDSGGDASAGPEGDQAADETGQASPEEGGGEEIEGDFVEGDPKDPLLSTIKATVHAKVPERRLICTGSNVHRSKGACYSCPPGYKRAKLSREMDHPQACKQEGPGTLNYRSAQLVGKAHMVTGCPGKNNYKSKKKCYVCPPGYKRAKLSREMDHPQACEEQGKPRHSYTPGTFVYKLETKLLPCPSGQFKHQGYCKSCPAGTIRLHYYGADTGLCLSRRKR